MNKRAIMLCIVGIALAHAVGTAVARSEAIRSEQVVAFEFVDSNGRVLETFPASHSADSYRAYLTAHPDARYRIRARNLTGERVGLVIAVDGRNIVSGERSDLGRREAMYVLGPYEAAEYAGWRTSTTEVRRFYFTDLADSYASRIGDESAVGVIAAAVYKERPRRRALRQRQAAAAPAAPRAEAEALDSAEARAGARSQAGTGFGEAESSHSIRVSFRPTRRPSQRAFYKYEWVEQLCARGLKRCAPPNRFWPDDGGFVPFPPGKSG